MRDLATLGWDDAWSAAFEPHREQGLTPGRVAAPHRRGYDVLTQEGESRSRLAGSFRRRAEPSELPVVGDWVTLDEKHAIVGVLPRRTKFSRRAADERGARSVREQVVAANVDVVFVVTALGEELDARLLSRYLTLAHESGARPVVLLTKADLEPDSARDVERMARSAGDVLVHAISARTGSGLDVVREHLPRGVTGALLGPSGAGKSTLVNALVGDDDLLATGDVRPDGAGRHTTTRRQLVLLPSGGLVIDNPGMREVHLWLAGEGLEEAFADVVELASGCRFADCRHESEPGCAVRAAVAEGRLPPERLEGYRALRQELEELERQLLRQERSRAQR